MDEPIIGYAADPLVVQRDSLVRDGLSADGPLVTVEYFRVDDTA